MSVYAAPSYERTRNPVERRRTHDTAGIRATSMLENLATVYYYCSIAAI